MLHAQATSGLRQAVSTDGTGQAIAAGAIWLDLLNATDAERALVATATGFDLPSRGDLSEIESSSRIYTEDGVLYLSTPLLTRGPEGPIRSPLGFIVSPNHMVTIRFAELDIIDQVAARFAMKDAVPASGAEALLVMLEALIDRTADALERVAGQLDTISATLFRTTPSGGKTLRANMLRALLTEISRAGDVIGGYRDSLLGLSRIAAYLDTSGGPLVAPALSPRLATARADIASLADYETHLQDKAQFLLDATLGFINVEQNDTFRVLTVVSVVGIPPTLIASIYGMNFETMPELKWVWGYPYGLVMILLSAVLPLLWFRRKGWI